MFTVCPTCGLTLAITARDLRAAHGHVRCGRCQNVFNALDSLADEHPHPPPAQRSEADRSQETSASGEIAVEFEAAEMAAPTEMAEPTDMIAAAEAAKPAPPPGEPLTEALRPEPLTAEQPPEVAFQLEPETPPRPSALWSVGTVLLVVILALQIVNHYRGALATFPSVAGALHTVYGALGITLTPAWDVHAYQARQLGATVSGTNPREITVRASIANLAQRAQPLPLLRVTLQDRFGRSIAARDVPPRDYLPSVPSPPLLAAGGRVDASVVLISPGSHAVGFVIDACLPRRHTVVCAHGP